jgi:hypothetical protein
LSRTGRWVSLRSAHPTAIIVESRGKAGPITLNRPERMNALNDQLAKELEQALFAFQLLAEALACAPEDQKERMRAFVAKKKPAFRNR